MTIKKKKGAAKDVAGEIPVVKSISPLDLLRGEAAQTEIRKIDNDRRRYSPLDETKMLYRLYAESFIRLAHLTEFQEAVIRLRFGLTPRGVDHPSKEVARILQSNLSTVRREYNAAMRKLQVAARVIPEQFPFPFPEA